MNSDINIQLKPIAFVSNSRKEISDDFWGSIVSELTLAEDFTEDAFKGIEEFSHVEVLYYFHKADTAETVHSSSHPRGNTKWPETGIFAMRRKDRPNHLGLTNAKVLKREGRSLFVTELDAIDGSPVLDIKPVLREFLPKDEIRQPKWASELMIDYWKKK